MISKILKSVGDVISEETKTEILSTEELCTVTEDVNKIIAAENTEADTTVDADIDTNIVQPSTVNSESRSQRRSQPSIKCKSISTRLPSLCPTVRTVLREQPVQKPSIQVANNCIVGSMNAKALFSSITDIMTGEATEEAIVNTELKLGNINVNRLSRFVTMKYSRDVIMEKGLEEVVPVLRTKTTLNSFANPRGGSKKANGDN